MRGRTMVNVDTDGETETTFVVQVCSKDGRMINEYTLTRQQHGVATLDAAEQRAKEQLLNNSGEALIIIVSEERLTKLCQSQRLVAPKIRAAKHEILAGGAP